MENLYLSTNSTTTKHTHPRIISGMKKGRSCGRCLVVDVTRFIGIWVGWRERIVATGSRDGEISRLIVGLFMVG